MWNGVVRTTALISSSMVRVTVTTSTFPRRSISVMPTLALRSGCWPRKAATRTSVDQRTPRKGGADEVGREGDPHSEEKGLLRAPTAIVDEILGSYGLDRARGSKTSAQQSQCRQV